MIMVKPANIDQQLWDEATDEQRVALIAHERLHEIVRKPLHKWTVKDAIDFVRYAK